MHLSVPMELHIFCRTQSCSRWIKAIEVRAFDVMVFLEVSRPELNTLLKQMSFLIPGRMGKWLPQLPHNNIPLMELSMVLASFSTRPSCCLMLSWPSAISLLQTDGCKTAQFLHHFSSCITFLLQIYPALNAQPLLLLP